MGTIWKWLARAADIRTFWPVHVSVLGGIAMSFWTHLKNLSAPTIFIYTYAVFAFTLYILDCIQRHRIRSSSFRLTRYGEEILLGVHISSEREVTIDTHPH